MEETKEKKAKTGDQKRRHYNRRRKKPSDGNQQGGSNTQQKSLSNGGYTKQNQNANAEKTGGNGGNNGGHNGNTGGSGRNRRNNHRSGGKNNNENKNPSREREPKKQSGYQPDSGKDAIRSFDLGTCEDEGKLMVFHFDKGTYTIAERKVIETVTDEEGKETVRYEDTEISSTRDKTAAYKAWNEIKRPKKGKAGRDKEKKEDTES